jgi:hypothetical protein
MVSMWEVRSAHYFIILSRSVKNCLSCCCRHIMVHISHCVFLCHQPKKAFTSTRNHPGSHEIIRSFPTSSTNSQLAVASFRQQTSVGTNIDERVSSHITMTNWGIPFCFDVFLIVVYINMFISLFL